MRRSCAKTVCIKEIGTGSVCTWKQHHFKKVLKLFSKTRKYKNDIGKIENMGYGAQADTYICRNGRKLGMDHIRHSKSRTGYVSEKMIYKCEDCNGCSYKSECIKGNNCNLPCVRKNKNASGCQNIFETKKR